MSDYETMTYDNKIIIVLTGLRKDCVSELVISYWQ